MSVQELVAALPGDVVVTDAVIVSLGANTPVADGVTLPSAPTALPRSTAVTDATAATEKDTGLDFTTGMTIMPFTAVDVRTVDSGKTIDFGLLSSESGGDADGFVAAASVATAAVVQAKCAATATLGALLRETVVADAGTASVRHSYTVGATAVSLTYTISSGSTTAAGYMRIPYTLKF